jgi:hypothetical protein
MLPEFMLYHDDKKVACSALRTTVQGNCDNCGEVEVNLTAVYFPVVADISTIRLIRPILLPDHLYCY